MLAPSNGLELFYETFGYPEDPPLLLIMGLNTQCIYWYDALCMGFVDRGFHVIRYDNRDVGLSTKVEVDVDMDAAVAAFAAGEELPSVYSLDDMADDAFGLLDHLGFASAHVVGQSMGGMIAQLMAIREPDRIDTLTSVYSSTSEGDVGQAAPDVVEMVLTPVPTEREAFITEVVRRNTMTGSPEHFDPDLAAEMAGRAYDRCFYPVGGARHLLAALSAPSRADGLAELTVPTLVVHGSEDRLVDPSGGKRTAELVPDAELVLVEGMGHDLPTNFWSLLIETVTNLVARSHAR